MTTDKATPSGGETPAETQWGPSVRSVLLWWPIRLVMLCGLTWAVGALSVPTAADVLLRDTGPDPSEAEWAFAKGLIYLTYAGIPLMWFAAFMKQGRSRTRVAFVLGTLGVAWLAIKLIFLIGYGDPLIGS